MNIQVYDQPGKGKRKCPALEGFITSKDCGKHRLKEIRCPADCKYLGHERYQYAQVAETFHQSWAEAIAPYYQKRDAFALDFLVLLEFSAYKFLKANPLSTDEELKEGLNFLHRQLSPIQVVEAVGASFGKYLVEDIQRIQKQNPQFDVDKAQEMVDLLSELLKSFEDEGQPRQAINGLMGHLENNFDLSSIEDSSSQTEDKVETPPKIITPE